MELNNEKWVQYDELRFKYSYGLFLYDSFMLKDCSNGSHDVNIRCNYCNFSLELNLYIKKKCALDNKDDNLFYHYFDDINHKHGKVFGVCDDCTKDICTNCLSICPECHSHFCFDCADICDSCEESYCQDCIDEYELCPNCAY
jgi:hypothetical protein